MDEDIIRGVMNNDDQPLKGAIAAKAAEIDNHDRLCQEARAKLEGDLDKLNAWHVNFFGQPSPSAKAKKVKRKRAQAGDNLTRIVEFLTSNPKKKVAEIAKATGINPSSVHTNLYRNKDVFVMQSGSGKNPNGSTIQIWSLIKEQ